MTKFKVGDWLISDAATRPTAYLCTSINIDGHYVVKNGYYSKDDKELRLAKWDEIPEEHRSDIIGYSNINYSYSIY
jgi:hypothetical protein